MDDIGPNPLRTTASTLFLCAVFLASFFLFFKQAYPPAKNQYRSDLRRHIQFAQRLQGKTMELPHPGLHIAALGLEKATGLPLNDAFAFVLAFAVTAFAALLLGTMNRLLPPGPGIGLALPAAAALLLAGSIWLPFIHRRMFLLQGSPNVWHNPTVILLKPLALIAFLLWAGRSWLRPSNPVGADALASATLLLATLVKPNFTLSFLPAAFLWLLLRGGWAWRPLGRGLAIAAPSIACLAWQHMIMFAGHHSNAITISFLTVWKTHSPYPLVALLQGSAFPLALLAFRFRRACRSPWLSLAWLNWVVAVLQAAIFAEAGRRMPHANFFWGYMVALTLLFLFSTVELLHWARTRPPRWRERLSIGLVSLLFCLHLASGAIYTTKIWSGGPYT